MSNIIPGFTPVAYTDFTQLNTGASSFGSASGGIKWLSTAWSGQNQMLVQSTPSTPWRATAHITNCGDWAAGMRYGMCVRQSSNGYSFFNALATRPGATVIANQGQWAKFTNYDTNHSYAFITNFPYYPKWWRIEDDGTNRISQVSYDGINWATTYSEGRTTFLTADQVGIVVYTGVTAYLMIDSWKLEAG